MTEKANPSNSRPIESFKTAGAIAYGGGTDGFISPSSEPSEISVQDGSINESNLNAFQETSSGTSLDVTIDGGEAFVFGSWIAIDTQTTVTLAGSTTGQVVYAGWNKDGSDDVIIGLSSDFASASGDSDQKIELYSFDTDSSGVVGVDDRRSFDQIKASSIEQGDGSGLDADAVDGFDVADLDGRYVTESGDTMSGPLTIGGDLSATDGETVWDESAGYIPQSRLENDSLTVAGNSVSLGGATAISHADLSAISSDDHHIRYSDEEAQDAVGSILNGDFVYDDAGNQILLTNNSLTVAGNTVSLGGSTNVDHNDLSSINTDDHHTRYTNEEAQDAIAGPFLTAGNALNKEYLDNSNSLTLEVAANSIQTTELDEGISPTWTSEHTFSGGITGLPEPIQDTDAARKVYVDSVAEGLDIKESVRVCAESNIDLTSSTDPNPVDGVSLSDGDRVLLKQQTDGTENGIYIASTATDPTTWIRSDDADEDSEVTSGLFVFVEGGDTHTNQGFVLTTNDPITLGTTALAFTQFSGAESFTAGTGITQTNNTISHSDTSTQADVSSSAGSAITDLNFDNFGHVTGASSSSFDNRYVNASGDTVSGTLTVTGIDLDGSGITDLSQTFLALGLNGKDLRMATGQSIEDGSGNTRVFLGSNSTDISGELGSTMVNFNEGARTIDMSNVSADLRLDTGRVIEDRSGNTRFELGTDRTDIRYEDGSALFRGERNNYARIYARSGAPFEIYDSALSTDTISYTTSSSGPGDLDLTNANINLSHSQTFKQSNSANIEIENDGNGLVYNNNSTTTNISRLDENGNLDISGTLSESSSI